MDKKKVIKAMYKYITSKDYLHPIFAGVHFEKERCYATDTHVLVIFNESIEQLDGKTINEKGEELNGRFPKVDAVFPSEKSEYPVYIDLPQLLKALNWHTRKSDFNKNDIMVLDHKAINIDTLRRLLSMHEVAGELADTKMFKTAEGRAVIVESKSLRSLIMPSMFNEIDVDSKVEDGCLKTVSYDKLINDYAFNHWRKQENTAPTDWLAKF